MDIIRPGHRYVLANFERPQQEGQVIQFIEKVPSGGDPAKLETVSDGTSSEEVLDMLLDRMEFLYQKLPSYETRMAIANVMQARAWLEKRTQDRLARGVEGKHVK